tara:strand:+ start:4204 stop:5262 length:1059 start_codon:yes stop_codon:yes gene_type:complete
MAKEYAYYIEGNKVAIVERDTAFDNNVNSKEYGPGVSRAMWKSPKTSVTDGLEIKYAYIPEYNLTTARNIGFNLTGDNDESVSSLYFSCYGEVNGYLTLFFPKITSAVDATGVNLNLSIVNANDYIVIHNHPQFNGVHKVQEGSANGFIKTYTKWSSGLGKAERDDTAGGALTYAGADDSITATGIPDIFNSLSAGDYIFIPAAETQEQNEGLFKVASINSTASDGILKVDTQYYLDITASTKGTLASQASAIEDQTDTTVNWMANKVLLCEGAYADVAGVNVLNDEADIIDIPSYLSKALVYYVKARLAEDSGQIELKEYNMREYKKHIEQYESSLMKGPRIMSSGPYAIR